MPALATVATCWRFATRRCFADNDMYGMAFVRCHTPTPTPTLPLPIPLAAFGPAAFFYHLPLYLYTRRWLNWAFVWFHLWLHTLSTFAPVFSANAAAAASFERCVLTRVWRTVVVSLPLRLRYAVAASRQRDRVTVPPTTTAARTYHTFGTRRAFHRYRLPPQRARETRYPSRLR